VDIPLPPGFRFWCAPPSRASRADFFFVILRIDFRFSAALKKQKLRMRLGIGGYTTTTGVSFLVRPPLARFARRFFFCNFTYIPRGAGLGSEYNPGPNSERDFSDMCIFTKSFCFRKVKKVRDLRLNGDKWVRRGINAPLLFAHIGGRWRPKFRVSLLQSQAGRLGTQ